VGGWPVFGVRDNEAAIHVLRNALHEKTLSLSPATK